MCDNQQIKKWDGKPPILIKLRNTRFLITWKIFDLNYYYFFAISSNHVFSVLILTFLPHEFSGDIFTFKEHLRKQIEKENRARENGLVKER